MNQLSNLFNVQNYEDVLEQVLHDLSLCSFIDDVHEAYDLGGQNLVDRIRAGLDHYGYAIMEKYGDE